MASHVIGSSADELRELREGMRKMLKENGEPPANGKWADIAVLEPVRDYKASHASTLLTFDAVVDAIGQIEAKRAQKPQRNNSLRSSDLVPENLRAGADAACERQWTSTNSSTPHAARLAPPAAD